MTDPAQTDTRFADNNEQGSFHAIVRGRVQGVGFRFYVLREARRLGLAGLVRNRPAGEVEVFAQGGRPSLRELESLLRRGPLLSRVDHVTLEWGVPVPQTVDFIIGS